MKNILLSALALAALLLSCDKEDHSPDLSGNDYLIFGHFYGFCQGEECVRTFKLTADKLYEDQNDNYMGHGDSDFAELSQERFEQVKHLPGLLPAELLQAESQTFGCPDCADQGGLYIEHAKDGEVRTWIIDNDKSAVPDYLHLFMDEVRAAIAEAG